MSDQKRRPEQSQDQTSQLSKEQLRNLMNDFLDQLIAAKPHLPTSMDNDQNPHEEQEEEPMAREIPSPADLFQAWQEGGAEGLWKLMATMDGEDEDDVLPEWDERRWR